MVGEEAAGAGDGLRDAADDDEELAPRMCVS
jgi:hypothetical protein